MYSEGIQVLLDCADMLLKIEWSLDPGVLREGEEREPNACPYCGRGKKNPKGHHEWCELDRLLKRVRY